MGTVASYHQQGRKRRGEGHGSGQEKWILIPFLADVCPPPSSSAIVASFALHVLVLLHIHTPYTHCNTQHTTHEPRVNGGLSCSWLESLGTFGCPHASHMVTTEWSFVVEQQDPTIQVQPGERVRTYCRVESDSQSPLVLARCLVKN